MSTTENKAPTLAELQLKVSPEVRTLADKLKAVAVFEPGANNEGGRFQPTSDFVEKEAGIVKEVYIDQGNKIETLMAATTLAHGELSNERMLKNPELKSTRMDLPIFGKDYLASKHTKSQTIGNATHHGITQMTYEVYQSKAHGQNQMGAVKDVIAASTRDLLANLGD